MRGCERQRNGLRAIPRRKRCGDITRGCPSCPLMQLGCYPHLHPGSAAGARRGRTPQDRHHCRPSPRSFRPSLLPVSRSAGARPRPMLMIRPRNGARCRRNGHRRPQSSTSCARPTGNCTRRDVAAGAAPRRAVRGPERSGLANACAFLRSRSRNVSPLPRLRRSSFEISTYFAISSTRRDDRRSRPDRGRWS